MLCFFSNHMSNSFLQLRIKEAPLPWILENGLSGPFPHTTLLGRRRTAWAGSHQCRLPDKGSCCSGCHRCLSCPAVPEACLHRNCTHQINFLLQGQPLHDFFCFFCKGKTVLFRCSHVTCHSFLFYGLPCPDLAVSLPLKPFQHSSRHVTCTPFSHNNLYQR